MPCCHVRTWSGDHVRTQMKMLRQVPGVLGYAVLVDTWFLTQCEASLHHPLHT